MQSPFGVTHKLCPFHSESPIYKPKVLPSIYIKYKKLTTVYFCQMENNHYPTMTQAKSRDAVVGWLWCVYVGQDVPDYQAITGYS